MFQFNIVFFNPPKQEYTEESLSPNLVYVEHKKRKVPCFKHHQSSSFWILYFHGNSQDLCGSAQFMYNLQKAMDINFNFLVVEYPGYGIYKNYSASEELIYEDAIVVYDELKKYCGNQQIYIMGRSMGTGPACYLGSLNKGQGIILISAFASFKKIATERASILKYIVEDRFKNVELAKSITLPVLLIHGMADDVIKYTQSIEIYQNLHSIHRITHFPQKMTHSIFNMVTDISEPIIDFINLINSK